MQAEDKDHCPGDAVENLLVGQEEPAGSRCGEAQQKEYGGQAQDEKQCGQQNAAARGTGRGHLAHRNPAHIGKIGRHHWQDAGRQEGQKPAGKGQQAGGDQACIQNVETEHGRLLYAVIAGGGTPVTPPRCHIRVGRFGAGVRASGGSIFAKRKTRENW